MIKNHVFFHFWQENLNTDYSIYLKSKGLKIMTCVFYCFSSFFHVFSWNFHDFSPLKNKSRCILLRFFQFWEFLNKSENFWIVFSLKFHEISTFFKNVSWKYQSIFWVFSKYVLYFSKYFLNFPKFVHLFSKIVRERRKSFKAETHIKIWIMK